MKKIVFLCLVLAGFGIKAQSDSAQVSFTFGGQTYYSGDSINAVLTMAEQKGEIMYDFHGITINNESGETLSQLVIELSTIDTLGLYAYDICTDQCMTGLVGNPINIAPDTSFGGLFVHFKFIDTYHTSQAYALYDMKLSIERTAIASLRIRFTPEHTEDIDLVENGNTLQAYPNPTTGEVTVAYSIQQPATLCIYDIQGRSVMQQPLTVGQQSIVVPVNDLPKGLYLYRILSEGGNTPTQKLMVQ